MPGLNFFHKRKAGNSVDQSNSTTPKEGTPNAPSTVVPTPKIQRQSSSEFSDNWARNNFDDGPESDFSFTGGNDEDMYFPSDSMDNDYMDESDTASFFGEDNAPNKTQGESLVTNSENQTKTSVGGFARFASRKPTSEATQTSNTDIAKADGNEENLHANRATAVTPNHRASAVATSAEKDFEERVAQATARLEERVAQATAPQQSKTVLHSTTDKTFNEPRPMVPTRANEDSSRDKIGRAPNIEKTLAILRRFSKPSASSKPVAQSATKSQPQQQRKLGNSMGSIRAQRSEATKAQPQNKQPATQQLGRNPSNGARDRLPPRIQTNSANTRGNPRPNAARTTTAPQREERAVLPPKEVTIERVVPQTKQCTNVPRPSAARTTTAPQREERAMLPPKEVNVERLVPQTKQHANGTDNRAMRKKTVVATAVTPNPRAVVRNNANENGNKDLSPQANKANRTETTIPNTLPQVQPMDLDPQEEPNAVSETANEPGASENLESNQAKFRSTVRETEDLQESIELELLDLNDQFSDVFSLLLRDLETAEDLIDKLESIQESAEEAISMHRQQEIF